jgi:hypothetical protein
MAKANLKTLPRLPFSCKVYTYKVGKTLQVLLVGVKGKPSGEAQGTLM